MPAHRVLLIEPFAYHADIARDVCHCLTQQGAEVVVLTAQGSNSGGWPGALRVLATWPSLAIGPDPAIMRGQLNPLVKIRALARIRRHSSLAAKAIDRAMVGFGADRIVMTTSDPLDLFGFRAAGCTSALSLAMVHDPPRSRSSRMAAGRLTRTTGRQHRTWLGCITPTMRDLYVAAGADPSGVLVVPNPALQPTASRATIPWSRRRPRLSYPGNGRREKGFDFFASAVPGLLSEFDVVVQCYQRGDEPDSVARAARMLHEIDSPRLDLVEGSISRDDYEALVADSMAVVLPYRPDAYAQGRISAVLPEAWAAGVPVIVSDGWWGADLVRTHGGGAIFNFGDELDLMRAARDVRDNLERMAAEAAAAYRALLEDAGPYAFARFVLDLTPGQTGT
jgi:glycosyltransferase involved in cell wall biosynthesis